MDTPRTAGGPAPEIPAVTTLGIIEGEVLSYLESHGAAPMRELIRELPWPATMITATICVLGREGLVRARRRESDVVIECAGPGFIIEPVFDARP